jgi:MYXO-CTERM domain-containing protein
MVHLLVTVVALGVVALAGPRAVPAQPAAGSGAARSAGMPAAITPQDSGVPTEPGGSWANVAAVGLASIGSAIALRRRRRR